MFLFTSFMLCINLPLSQLEIQDKFDITIKTNGGGINGQAQAI
jgi:ribosomal protein S9